MQNINNFQKYDDILQVTINHNLFQKNLDHYVKVFTNQTQKQSKLTSLFQIFTNLI